MAFTSTEHGAQASRKRQRDSEDPEEDRPLKVIKRDTTPVVNVQGGPSADSQSEPTRDHIPLEPVAGMEAQKYIHDPDKQTEAEQISGKIRDGLPTAVLRDLANDSFTKGLARVVIVEDGVSNVIALLPDSDLMKVLNAAVKGERKLRQAMARAPLQKQHLKDWQVRRRELRDRIEDLAQKHKSVSNPLIRLVVTMEGESMRADLAAKPSIDNHLADEEHKARYCQSGLARMLETMLVKCQYLEEDTTLGDASEWDKEFDQKYDLSNSHLSIEDEVDKILKDHSIELPAESDSPDAAAQLPDSPRERDDESEYEFDPEIEAKREALYGYSVSCREYREAHEALENYKETFSGALQRDPDTGEIQEDASVDASHQYFREVQRLTAAIKAAEASWIDARTHVQSLGIDIGFDENWYDYRCYHDEESILLPGDFPEPRHNPEFEPEKWWHDGLPKHAVTRAMAKQNSEKSAQGHDQSISEEVSFGAGFSTIEDSPQRRYLIREWQAHCEKLRVEFESRS